MKYAILSALPEEQQALYGLLQNRTSRSLCGRTFIEGTLEGCQVVLALSGIGKVAAALTTALVIHEFEAKALLFTGVAGSVDNGVTQGDVVLATHLVQYDFDCSPLFDQYQIPGTGMSKYPTNRGINRQIWASLKTEAAKSKMTESPFKIHRGVIASGDQFIKGQTDQIKAVKSHFHDTLAVEMEGAAVAQVAYDFEVPFSLFRIISDETNHKSSLDFTQFLPKIPAIMVPVIVNAMNNLASFHLSSQREKYEST